MRLFVGTITALGLALAVPVAVQAQAGISPGMQVTDSSGAPVGTVKELQGSNVLVRTDKHEALLPSASFTVSNGKLLFGMTQTQLDAQIEKSLAASNAAIVAGASVTGLGGVQVGSINSVADGKATITLKDGKMIAVPQEGLRGNADGTVTIGYSEAQLEALVKDAGAKDASSAPPKPAGDTSGK